ncbi:flavocytochrome c flavin subunit, putative [Shewanella benthica KT99]|uniref:Flavocytochrome c flavin subunit, putative n=1 Tax=Shewanella benthica KT99 TaxID=314608 RepID=A9CWD0_9GAMM|nr:flavocytochrome c flavin subunit, putative [Shewanella benthica KT99]
MQDRRNFLKLGAGAALGGRASTMPGTVMASECGQIKWNESADVIVVGSGFAGLSAALNVKRSGVVSARCCCWKKCK